MNRTKREEQTALSDALQEMMRAGITSYRHAKIEFLVSPGAAKIRARKTKEEGDAAVKAAPSGNAVDEVIPSMTRKDHESLEGQESAEG